MRSAPPVASSSAAAASVDAWLAAMRRADFPSAWQISDALLARRAGQPPDWSLPRHQQWVWTGAPLDGQRVLVRCYHGLGDSIQFARLLPSLAQRVRQLTIWLQPELIDLFKTIPHLEASLLPLHDGTPGVPFDVDIELGEVAHALRIDQRWLPGPIPYFCVPPTPRPSDRFCVGLLGQAGDWNPTRSVPAELLEQLIARFPELAWYALQLAGRPAGALDLSTPDILQLAGRLQALDLLITVDTMLAHLAGALGVRTWLLLPAAADWRWLEHRSDSPWYPSLRLFRQPTAGAWPAVLEAVATQLAHAAGATRAAAAAHAGAAASDGCAACDGGAVHQGAAG